MTERVAERVRVPFVPKVAHALARNSLVHRALNSEPVHWGLDKLVVSLYIRSLRDPENKSRINPTSETMLGKLGKLERIIHPFFPDRDRVFETKMGGSIRTNLEKSIETGEETNLVRKIKRTMNLMGEKYLKTILLDYLVVNFGLGTLNEYFLAKEGKPFFHYLALQVNSECNAQPRCPGCFAARDKDKLDFATMDKTVGESKALGTRFTIALGGETLLEKENLFKLFRKYPRMPFLVATNGILVDEAYAKEVSEMGNVITMINTPGLEPTTTKIRRTPEAWESIRKAAENLRKYGAASGFASTVYRSNFKEVSSPEFVQQMIDFGMILGLYFGYTDPIGCSPQKELGLTPQMNEEFSQRVKDVSSTHPMFLVDTSGGREKLIGGCPAGKAGLIYVQSNGNVGACPMVPQMDKRLNVRTNSMEEILKSSYFEAIREGKPSCLRNPVFLSKLPTPVPLIFERKPKSKSQQGNQS